MDDRDQLSHVLHSVHDIDLTLSVQRAVMSNVAALRTGHATKTNALRHVYANLRGLRATFKPGGICRALPSCRFPAIGL